MSSEVRESLMGNSSRKKKTKQEVIQTVRQTAVTAVRELKLFHAFVTKEYITLAQAFEQIADGDEFIDGPSFMRYVAMTGFSGRSDKVFFCLCDDQSWDAGLIITRKAFLGRLATMGNRFLVCVQEAIAQGKELEERGDDEKSDIYRQQSLVIDRKRALMEQLRRFLKTRYSSVGAAFQSIAPFDQYFDLETFERWGRTSHFPGDVRKTFHVICDEQGYVWQDAFFCGVLSARDMDEDEFEQDRDMNLIRRASKKNTTTSKRSGSRDSTLTPDQLQPAVQVKFHRSRSVLDEPEEERVPEVASMQRGQTSSSSKSLTRSFSVASLEEKEEKEQPVFDDDAEEELPEVIRVRSRESSKTLTAPRARKTADRRRNQRDEAQDGQRRAGRAGTSRTIEVAKAAQFLAKGKRSAARRPTHTKEEKHQGQRSKSGTSESRPPSSGGRHRSQRGRREH